MASQLFHRTRRGPVRGRSRPGVLAAALSVTLLLGCEPYVVGNGVPRDKTFSVGSFEGIRIESGVAAIITVNPLAEKVVRVTADENVLQWVEVTVEEDRSRGLSVLRVRVTEDFEPSVRPALTLTIPSLRYIRAFGAKFAGTDIEASGIQTTDFEVDVEQGYEVSLRGTGTGRLTAKLAGGSTSGGARLFARGYAVPEAAVDLSVGSQAELLVATAITGSVTGGSRLTNFGLGRCEGPAFTASPDSEELVTCAGWDP